MDEVARPGRNRAGEGVSMQALVIDDSRTIRIIIRDILRSLGIEVVEAGDGHEGLAQLRASEEIGRA